MAFKFGTMIVYGVLVDNKGFGLESKNKKKIFSALKTLLLTDIVRKGQRLFIRMKLFFLPNGQRSADPDEMLHPVLLAHVNRFQASGLKWQPTVVYRVWEEVVY